MPEPVAAGGLSLALLQQRWPAILEAVNGSSKRVHALAKEGEPIEVEDGVVVLRFAHHFHAEQCSAESSQDMFGTALERVVGSRARLRCVVDDGGSPPPSVAEQETEAREAAEREAVAQAEEAERVGEVPDPDEAHRQAVALVERDLGGRVVDDAVAGGR